MKSVLVGMLSVIAITLPSHATTAIEKSTVTFNPRPICADMVGIPRNSDNFTDEEWKMFQDCVNYFYEMDGTTE